MKETFFLTPEKLYEEVKTYVEKGVFSLENFDKAESPKDIYIFQPAFIEVFEKLLFELSKENLKELTPKLEKFVEESPYTVENKEELIWALQLWKESPNASFTKTLNTAKARSNKIHSVIR
ncbi:MAG: hypothetical protein GXO22_04855 [Aquificae bacterium]|nr:hypothetical protein [Aquificota bacterium]